MNPWINYHHLLYFKTIAEEQSVSGAAAKLRLGQPTLSAQLKQFEDTLGVQLFERQHKRLILTEQGKVALDYARQIFRMGDEMYEVLQDRIVPSRIHLQIGALDSVPKQIILELSKAAYKVSPCAVTLVEGKSDEMIRELSAHKIDLFVTNHLPALHTIKGLHHRRVIRKQVSIFGAPTFKSLRKGFPRSISNQKFILPTHDSKLRIDFEHWARVNDVSIDVIAETQDVSLKKIMAIEGLGLIPAASYSVKRQHEAGVLVELGPLRELHEELYLISADRRMTNPIAAQLMKSFTMES